MNWLKALRDVDNIEDLLALVNEYLLDQPEEYWSWIPTEVRPTLVGSLDDLDTWHRKLSHELARVATANIRMQDLGVFFVRAWARALEIRDRQEADKVSSNDRDFQCTARPPARKRIR